MNKTESNLSPQLRHNWAIDALLFASTLPAILSGVYFLYLPGGYQGGRNPAYGFNLLFSRQTWGLLHTWSGVGMIAAATIHIVIHWQWITGTARRYLDDLSGRCTCQSSGRKTTNLITNLVSALSFLLVSISGVSFLFFPGGQHGSGTTFLLTRSNWDMIHTWSGVALTAAALIHFAIHWRWVVTVSGKVFARPDKVEQRVTDQPSTNGFPPQSGVAKRGMTII